MEVVFISRSSSSLFLLLMIFYRISKFSRNDRYKLGITFRVTIQIYEITDQMLPVPYVNDAYFS